MTFALQTTDIGIGKVSMTDNRFEAVDYIYPYNIDSLTFSSPLPTLSGYSNLLEPFDNSIWICILSSILTIISVKYIIFGRLDGSSVRVLVRQPMKAEKCRGVQNRLLLFNWLIMAVILTSSYAGCIYSMISVPKKWQIDSSDKLIESLQNGLIEPVMYAQSASYYNLFSVKLVIWINFASESLGRIP